MTRRRRWSLTSRPQMRGYEDLPCARRLSVCWRPQLGAADGDGCGHASDPRTRRYGLQARSIGRCALCGAGARNGEQNKESQGYERYFGLYERCASRPDRLVDGGPPLSAHNSPRPPQNPPSPPLSPSRLSQHGLCLSRNPSPRGLGVRRLAEEERSRSRRTSEIPCEGPAAPHRGDICPEAHRANFIRAVSHGARGRARNRQHDCAGRERPIVDGEAIAGERVRRETRRARMQWERSGFEVTF